MARMKSFHFNVSSCEDYGVGFCARVVAETPKQALTILRRRLPIEHNVYGESKEGEPLGEEYIECYFEPKSVTIQDIDFWNYVDDPKQEDHWLDEETEEEK